jgi:ABC-type polysaccharide/polyol phosphate export permease
MSVRVLQVASALWLRDMLRFKKERSRWLGLISQPLLFWFLIGFGLNKVVSIPESGTSYLQFFYCGSLVMCLLFTTLFGAISLIEDAQTGFLRAILASPAPRVGITAGKIAGLVTLVAMQIALLLLFVPIAGLSFSEIDWFLLLSAVILGSAVLSALNLGSALLINSVQGYHAVMGLILFPLWIVSGAMFPIPQTGLWSWIAALNPMTHISVLFRAGLIPATQHSDSVFPISILVIQFLAAFWFATAMTHSRKARHV